MIAQRARRHAHRAKAELPADRLLHRRSLAARARRRCRRRRQHGDEQARPHLAQAVDMAHQLVDPDRDLVAEGRRHRVLAVRAPGHRHVGGPLGQIGHRGQHVADLPEEDRMRLAQHQEIAGLGDVLRRGAPMHPTTVRLADDAPEFPDQRHQSVPRAGKAFIDARPVHQLELGFGRDRFGGRSRDDAEPGLGVGQRRLDIEQACQRFSWR
jgi:hypothetical protein